MGSNRRLVVFFVVALALLPISAVSATKITPGSPCKTLNQKVVYLKKTYKCIQSGKKKVWSKGVIVSIVTAKPTPSPSADPTAPISVVPSPSPSASPSVVPSVIPICSGTAKSEQGKYKISIQLMDPFDNSKTLNGGGMFLRVNSIWIGYPADINGQINILVDSGRYEIDTLPPVRSEYYISRKGYVVSVGQDGQYSIPNSKLVENKCQIGSELTPAGLKRMTEVKKKDYRVSVESVNLQTPTSTIKYIAPISNRKETPIVLDLYPWESKHFVLLTISNRHNPVVIGRLLQSLDSSYEIYNEITSEFPKYSMTTSSWSRTINNKSVIAEIPDIGGDDSSKIISCGGNACTAVSTLGIEIRWQVLESTLMMLEYLDVYDHTLFYEQGRTFWPQISCAPKISLKRNDPTITGFAVLMRYVVIKNLGLQLGPDESESGDTYYDRILATEQIFSQNETQNLQSIFDEKSIINGFDGNAIWASLMLYLGKNYGGLDFYKKFFSSCDLLQSPASDLLAVRNWKTLAELSAGRNLDSIFIQRWRMR
jgi:hypothetical protein